MEDRDEQNAYRLGNGRSLHSHCDRWCEREWWAAPASTPFVSIGDSLAFGYEPNLVANRDFNPDDYHGYTEDYAAMRPHTKVVNFGCSGETTETLIKGGCPWLRNGLPLHHPYPDGMSQLDAAVTYLVQHPDTRLVSVDIGSNDLFALNDQCNRDVACIEEALPQTIANLTYNYAVILGALKTAAPQAQFVVFNLYNPLASVFPGSDELLSVVNDAIAGVAASYGASVADAFSAINHVVGSPSERDFICTRTWECSSYQDSHPTDLGYQEMAIALLHATQPEPARLP